MTLDSDSCYAALAARDGRFDGVFFVGVSTTGIYCRPVCAVRLPARDRCSFFAGAAEAEAAGFRPCLRCRPELAPGAAPMDAGRRIADLAVARIEAGTLSEISLTALAAEFGVSARQLRRGIKQAYGVTPIELAQTRRLLLAKQLLTDTKLNVAEVAFASGFSSVRRFNHLFSTRYRLSPTRLRRVGADLGYDGARLRLGYRAPLAWDALARFMAVRATPRTEQYVDGVYRRTIRIGRRAGWIAARRDSKRAELKIDVSPDLLPAWPALRARLRHLFDLDAHPDQIESHLARDKHLAPRIAALPGLRIPGAIDGFDLALRTVLGQQISVAAATTLYGRFTEAFGEAIETPFDGLTHLVPTAEAMADASIAQVRACGLPRKRAETVVALARAVVDDGLRLAPDTDSAPTREQLVALPGIGPWSVAYIAMRALADPDALPAGDLGLRKALGVTRAAEVDKRSQGWRPWRGYAALLLWSTTASGG